MLKSRAITDDDLKKVKRLHDLHYSQFEFPNFNRLMCGFIIEDEDGETVIAGGIEAVGEAVLVTDKNKSRIKIGKALVEAQRISAYLCKISKLRDLYAFVDNPEYAKHLVQHGFEVCDGQVLRLRITDG